MRYGYYMPETAYPLYLRQAIADQNSAPQRDAGTLKHEFNGWQIQQKNEADDAE